MQASSIGFETSFRRFLLRLSSTGGTINLLHAGTSQTTPGLDRTKVDSWQWAHKALICDPADIILQRMLSIEADLVMMTTFGPNRFDDNHLGTTSQRVLRQAKCPIIVLQVDSQGHDGNI